jgi:hypothetical protein
MRDRLSKLIESLFSIFLIIAILGGGVVFLMYILGIIVGGNFGNILALNARNVMIPFFIRSAAIAILLGLIHHYVTGEHTLTLDENE